MIHAKAPSRSLFPDVSAELIEHLRARFPDRLPTAPVSDTEIAALIGEQRVIQFLIATKAAQERKTP